MQICTITITGMSSSYRQNILINYFGKFLSTTCFANLPIVINNSWLQAISEGARDKYTTDGVAIAGCIYDWA